MKRTMIAFLGLAIALLAFSGIAQAGTMENLMEAYNGESNASAKYEAYAKKADEEGYGKVASLFRAASHAEKIHAAYHAGVIKKMGGTPKMEIKLPTIGTTKDNLAEAIKGETYENTEMYPKFMDEAQKEKNGDAVRGFNYAMMAEAEHAKLYKTALDNLDSWKEKTAFYVCPTCGYTVATLDGMPICPICGTASTDYEKIS